MNFLHIYLFLCANFVAAKVSYYKKCYEQLSICLITNIDDDKSKLSQLSAEEWCKANSSKLAIIPDEMVDSAMREFINEDSAKLDSDVIITNGRRPRYPEAWKWVNGRTSAYYPSVNNNAYNYVYIVVSSDSSYSPSNGLSTWTFYFICSYLKKFSDFRCSDEYQLQRDTCYKIHNELATWFDARNICLKEGSDLAIFKDGTPPPNFELSGRYWIGQRREIWYWRNDQRYVDLNRSNWNDGYPRSSADDCLCLKAKTGKWTNCNCLEKYRYICIQEMTTAVMINTTSSSAPTTTVTTHSTLSVGDSTFQIHSTSTQMLDNNFRDETSRNPSAMKESENLGMLLGLGVGSACLLILIIVIVVVVCIKNRRSHSVDHEPTRGNSPPPMTPKDDAPNTVYALVVPNDDEPVRSPTEKTPNQTVYAELDLEPKGKITRRASQPVRYPSERTPDQSVYAEVDLLPKRKTLGRAIGQQESDVNDKDSKHHFVVRTDHHTDTGQHFRYSTYNRLGTTCYPACCAHSYRISFHGLETPQTVNQTRSVAYCQQFPANVFR